MIEKIKAHWNSWDKKTRIAVVAVAVIVKLEAGFVSLKLDEVELPIA